MKLDYRILWVEDKIETKQFQALIQNITRYLEDQFFKVTIQTAEDLEEFKLKFEGKATFDLIITDLNLNESHGSEVINFVRDEKHISTEIFFYSANSDLKNTSLINNNRITFYQLDGQDYHKALNSTIIELIKLTIYKFQNIVAMRGMIMHETCSLDLKMIQIVREYLYNKLNAESCEIIFQSVLGNIQKFTEEKAKKVSEGKMKKILDDNVLFSSSQKIFALGEILKYCNQDDFSDDYNKEVISYRNQFAHAELAKDDNGVEYFKVKVEGKDDILIFDEDLCRTIRKNIIKHENGLDKLEALFKKVDAS